MSIFLGTAAMQKAYIGSSEIEKIYQGTTEIYTSSYNLGTESAVDSADGFGETGSVSSTASFTFNATLSELALDQGNGSQHMDGHVKQLVVFKEILSDAELAALTS